MPHPRRGDVYWVDFDPAKGVEQRGRRPAVVIQNDHGNRVSPYTVVAALSSAPLPRVYPFTVALAAGERNLPRECHVNCAQLRTIDKARLDGFIGCLDEDRIAELDAALRFQLAL